MENLEEIRNVIEELAAIIGASGQELPTYGYSQGDARPHLELDESRYHYVISERGNEYIRVSSKDLDEILYRVFDFATAELGRKYQMQHFRYGQDPRKQIFAKQLELLSMLSEDWAARTKENQQEQIKKLPFDDFGLERAMLTKAFRDKGYSQEEAWGLAQQEYPLPSF